MMRYWIGIVLLAVGGVGASRATTGGTTPTASAAAIQRSTNFVFSTMMKDTKEGAEAAPPLRRQRRRNAVAKQEEEQAEFKRDPVEEDRAFWARMLTDEMGSIPPEPAPVAPPPTNPPVEAPAPCPVVVEVDCVAVDGSQACSSIDPPASGTGDACLVEVEYSYTFTNEGSEIERIYSLEITRSGDTADITDTFPITDIAPGSSTIVFENVMIDICKAGDDAFVTEAAFVTGPPCDVEVVIACESEEGDECRQLPQADKPDQCLIDITYTYTVTNIGDVDANIILFTRTRNGEFKDLIDLLDDPFLAVADVTAVEETEEIDRCVQQSFATNTIVAQIPNADLLCEDVGFYP